MNLKQIEDRLRERVEDARRKAEDAQIRRATTEALDFDISGMLAQAQLYQREGWDALEKDLEAELKKIQGYMSSCENDMALSAVKAVLSKRRKEAGVDL